MRLSVILWFVLVPIHFFITYYWSTSANHYFFISIRVVFLVIAIYSFLLLIKYGNKALNTFIYLGFACLFLFVIRGVIETITELLNFYPNNWLNNLDENYRFIGLRLGVIIESIFFSIGLIFKGKQLSKEQRLKELNLQKQYIEQLETTQKWQKKYQTELEQEIAIKAGQLAYLEKEQAIERTRSQIAQDIHDEVGMHLTKIILTAELATRLKDSNSDKKPQLSTDIAHEARQVESKLKEIIFIINAEYNTFSELQAFIREKTNEFWANSTMRVQFDFPDSDDNTTIIPIEMKRHLLMIFRESQNNIAKYAAATEVALTLKITHNNDYIFSIKDNGKGFDVAEKHHFSRGLNGIYHRAELIGAIAKIESEIGHGTTITILGDF